MGRKKGILLLIQRAERSARYKRYLNKKETLGKLGERINRGKRRSPKEKKGRQSSGEEDSKVLPWKGATCLDAEKEDPPKKKGTKKNKRKGRREKGLEKRPTPAGLHNPQKSQPQGDRGEARSD